jgi:hypothetical protein
MKHVIEILKYGLRRGREKDEHAVTVVNLLIYSLQTTKEMKETEHNWDTRPFLFPFVHTALALLLLLMLHVIPRDKCTKTVKGDICLMNILHEEPGQRLTASYFGIRIGLLD